jgi:hypothetical protein
MRSRSRVALHDLAYSLHQNDVCGTGKQASVVRSTGVRRRRRASRRGGDKWRRDDGEPVSTSGGTTTVVSSSTSNSLTLRRRNGAVARRPGGSGGSGQRRRRGKERRRRCKLEFGDGRRSRGGWRRLYRARSLGEQARGPGTRWHGRRVGVCPELDPGSVAGWCGGGRRRMTRGPRASVAGGSDANMGRNGPKASDGRR